MSLPYVLGVDGGNSKTYAVLVDQTGTRLGSGIAASGNHQGTGVDVALGHMDTAISQALQAAGLCRADVQFAQFGLAGADRPRDFSVLRPALATLGFEAWDVVCDTLEGLRTGSEHNEGVVLICGSGTNAMGRHRNGAMVQTGGFGYLFGDAAGGHFLAQQAFRAAIRSWELREEPSLLVEEVPRQLGFRDIEHMYNHYLDHDVADVPGDLTVVLHQTALAGDALALRILRETGRELGLAANSVIRRLGGFGDDVVRCVLVGSVFQKGRNPQLLEALRTTVHQAHPQVNFVLPDVAPVYGAVLLAMDQLGIPVTMSMMAKFASYGGYAD